MCGSVEAAPLLAVARAVAVAAAVVPAGAVAREREREAGRAKTDGRQALQQDLVQELGMTTQQKPGERGADRSQRLADEPVAAEDTVRRRCAVGGAGVDVAAMVVAGQLLQRIDQVDDRAERRAELTQVSVHHRLMRVGYGASQVGQLLGEQPTGSEPERLELLHRPRTRPKSGC